jgi:pimeloyl-ACP methyl ester carboxylesterase
MSDLHTTIDGQGSPLLLIHGTAASIWGDLPALLAPHGTVIAYDRRGFGESPGPPGGTLTTHAADAAALLERHAGEPALLVGWSIGGVIALELALRRTELVRGLVLIEPPLHAKRHPRPRMLSAIAGAQVTRLLRNDETGARRFLEWALRATEGPSGLDRLAPSDRAAALANAAAILREIPHGTGEHLSVAEIARIAVPIELLAGTLSDPTFTAAARRIARRVRTARLTVVPGCGHALQIDNPAAVTGAVERALSRTGAAAEVV